MTNKITENLDERRHHAEETKAAVTESLVDEQIKAINADVGEMERIITENADLLANIWVLHRGNSFNASRLIYQQLENCIVNDAESTIAARGH